MSQVTDEAVFAYFSSLGSLAKKILEDQERIRLEYGLETWDRIDPSKREEILDEWLIKHSISDRYDNLNDGGENQMDYPSCFPRLITRPGGKLVAADSELDIEQSGWQDEHSAPFSWRSKSQEDLSLADLDFSAKDRGRPARLPYSPATPQGDNMPRPNPWRPGHNVWDSPFLASQGYTDSGYPSSQGSKHSSLEDVPVATSNDTSMETETDGNVSVDSKEAISVAVKNYLEVGVNPSFIESSEDVSRMSAINVPPVTLPRVQLDNSSKPGVSVPRLHTSDVSATALSHGEVNRAYNTDTDSDREQSDPQKTKLLKQKEKTRTTPWSRFVGEEQETASPAVAQLICAQREHEGEMEETSFSHVELTAVQHPPEQLSDETDPQKADNIPKSGFDFLDNW